MEFPYQNSLSITGQKGIPKQKAFGDFDCLRSRPAQNEFVVAIS